MGYDYVDYLAELPKGSNTIKNFTLAGQLYPLGGVQWDGTHITLSNPQADDVYRLSLGKSAVKIVGVTHFRAWQNDQPNRNLPYTQTLIRDGVFLGQTTTTAEVGVWPYPAGGNPGKVLSGFASGNVNISSIAFSVPTP
jgi:hypothetical protein